MVNILLERYTFNDPMLYDTLKAYIKPQHRVAVVPFSFRDNRVKGIDDWEDLYGKDHGKFYGDIIAAFGSYGIAEEQITFLNYFTDSKESARQKAEAADILHFLGGLPDRMYERLAEFDLLDVMAAHDGIAMGYSAGAVIQLAEYHLSPDKDYPAFGYYPGIGYLDSFYEEVHYTGSDVQKASIQKVLAERGKPIYATGGNAAIVVDNGDIKTLGDVEVFYPEMR